MKTRAEMKQLAKQAFLSRYWLCVGVYVLFMLVMSASTPTGIVMIVLAGPLTVGLSAFSIQLQQGREVGVGTMFNEGFSVNFLRKVGAYWWRELFTFLWTMLFIVPGIVKTFSYAMQPYILAECPDVTADQSLKLSMRMMQGHKGELFVLYLSFLGWLLLSGLTFGILVPLYVGPYMQQTEAQFYLEVKRDAIASGAVREQELYPQNI